MKDRTTLGHCADTAETAALTIADSRATERIIEACDWRQIRTKEKNMDWRTLTISGKGMGVFLAAGAENPDFGEHKTFATLALAKAYLNTKADIS